MNQPNTILFRRDRTWVVAFAMIVSMVAVSFASLLVQVDDVFAAQPTLTSSTTADTNNDGTVDQITLVFSENVDINDTSGVADGLDSLALTDSCTIDNQDLSTVGGNNIVIAISNCTAGDTGIVPTVTYTSQAGAANNFAISDTATSTEMANAENVVSTDGAAPIITAVVLSSASGRNRVSFTYSENMTVVNGASTATMGDTTSAGTVAGFGTFATTGDVTVATTKNTVGGNGTGTLYVDLADQAAAFLIGTSTTGPSGVFTEAASASITDANSNQVNTSGADPTASGGGSWDLTKPTISSITVSDSAGNNGQIDRAVIVFDSAVRDANITDGDAALSSAAGTTTGAFSTGTANDATTTFLRGADDAAVDTALGAETNFTYSAATTSITDLAGNLLDTTVDGAIATGDSTEVDGANPIILSVVLGSGSGFNNVTFTYSEAITVSNGASTTLIGDVTTAGTVAGIGSFATTGDVTVPTTLNTISGSGSANITISLASEATGYMNSASTIEASGVFTEVASASLVDANSNQVNTSGADPTASGGGSWDLTKPTISSITVSDSANNDGKIDRAVIVFDSAVRDANITNADAALSSTAGTTSGTFTTGTANDATTTFNRSADDAAVDTALGTETDFTYSGATTFIVDLAGNLLDTAVDGDIATADSTEVDGANPIVTAVTITTSGAYNALTFAYSENVTVTDGASTTVKGDVTTAGTVAGFGSFATTGNVTVPTTGNTTSGSGSSTITLTFASQTSSYMNSTSTTEPSGVFTPVASAQVADSASNTANTSATPTATGTGWDLTKPTISTAQYVETGTADGQVDRVDITFTEDVSTDFSADKDEWTVDTAGSMALTAPTLDGDVTVSTTAVRIVPASTTADVTGSATVPQMSFTRTAGLLKDAAGNLVADFSTQNVTDGAGPVILSGTYESDDGDGEIDQVVYTTSADIGMVCTAFTATTDWTVGTAGTVTLAENASDSCATNGTSTFTISLGADGATDTTGGATAPIVTYTQPGNGLEDGAGNDVPTSTSETLVDNAAPVVVTVTPTESSSGNSRSADIVITFSESMVTTFDSGTEFTASADPGGTWSDVWSSSDKVVTLSNTSNFACNNTITVTTTEANIDAAAGSSTVLITTGPEDGDWSFDVATCGTSGGGGGGGVSTPSYDVDLSSPTSTDTLTGGTIKSIEWTSSNDALTRVNLSYSIDGGSNYTTIVSNYSASTGRYNWTVPNVDTAEAVVKIEGHDLATILASDTAGEFTIESVTVDETPAEEGGVTALETGEMGISPVTGELEAISSVNAGDFIRSTSLPTVYFVADDLTRRPFYDANIFFTWTNSFDDIVWVTDATLPTMSLGAPMLPKSGVVLVKMQSDPKVYAVEDNSADINKGVLRWITSEEAAIDTYGSDWADYVIDIQVTLFSRFTYGDDVNGASDITVDLTAMKTRAELTTLAQ